MPLTVTLERDTRLEAGTHFAHVMGKPSLRWTPVEDFTADADGSFTFMWRAEQTGPIDAAIDSITVIATPVVGWSAITASGEVAIGHDADDDDNARRRREASVQRAGSAATAALRADLLAVATSCQIFENWTDAADPTTGLPPKSFEAVVDAVAATDEIAQILWDSRPAGIESVGTSSGTALDAEGKPHVMRFSRTAQVEVWVTYELVRLDGYVGDDAFKATVATRLDASLKPGDSVSTWEIGEAAHGLGAKIRRVRFGLTPAPSTDTEIAIGTREVARFDAGRITHA